MNCGNAGENATLAQGQGQLTRAPIRVLGEEVFRRFGGTGGQCGQATFFCFGQFPRDGFLSLLHEGGRKGGKAILENAEFPLKLHGVVDEREQAAHGGKRSITRVCRWAGWFRLIRIALSRSAQVNFFSFDSP